MPQNARTPLKVHFPTQYLGSVSVLLRATTLMTSHVVSSCTVALVQPVVHKQRFLGKGGKWRLKCMQLTLYLPSHALG